MKVKFVCEHVIFGWFIARLDAVSYTNSGMLDECNMHVDLLKRKAHSPIRAVVLHMGVHDVYNTHTVADEIYIIYIYMLNMKPI